MQMSDRFRKFSKNTSELVGSPWAFLTSLIVVVLWSITGPVFGYSDTWQLVINTGTTIVTFLMVFLIQNTQNRDSKAIHLKLDELIRSIHGARDSLLNLEDLSDEELAGLHDQFENLRKEDRRGVHAIYKTIEEEMRERKTAREKSH
jgi:low affinity Fe/Cu permease